MFTAFAFGVGSVTGGIQGDPSLVEQIQTRYRLSTSDVNQQTMHKTMKVVGEFALSEGDSLLHRKDCRLQNKAELGLYFDSAIYSVALGKILEISALQCPCVGN